jgi:hypothetical protein
VKAENRIICSHQQKNDHCPLSADFANVVSHSDLCAARQMISCQAGAPYMKRREFITLLGGAAVVEAGQRVDSTLAPDAAVASLVGFAPAKKHPSASAPNNCCRANLLAAWDGSALGHRSSPTIRVYNGREALKSPPMRRGLESRSE